MRKMRLFDLSIAGVVERFYLMMAIVVLFGFLGKFTLATIFGFAIATSFILGVSHRKATKKAIVKEKSKLSPVEGEERLRKAA